MTSASPTIVWSLQRCEEYWMQESHGLFATREAALESIPNVLLIIDHPDGSTIVIGRDDSHYSHPIKGKIFANGKIEVTLDNVWEYLEGFDFYQLDHFGYPVWGIFPTKVHTTPKEIK